ncbi:MAG: UDP-N-acetylmuramate:L-alanyl-gamma-D-glutamyl-meso-diaminopimelate ligase, partial [Candidatus Hydrogenedentes bacterium]|nr:UDP-N-acetylmuramate:L-alanyl-gamma-D-glutamyl-meso-diaminopimelate ligase [Candidatus Hydrogenedentota bacterium]
HGDIYRDVEEIELAFRRMLRQIPKAGLLLTCADSPRAAALREHAFSRVETYGFADDADWRGVHGGVDDAGYTLLNVHSSGAAWGEFRVPLAGRHNAQNAIAAIGVAAHHGGDPRALADALADFKGVRRRMEVFLESDGVTYVDDFAHHPTAVRETIAAARERWPRRRLRVLFEPRSNTTVTNAFQDDLFDAFRAADEVWFGPIYRAESIPVDTRLDVAALAKRLTESGASARAAHSAEEIAADVHGGRRPGDLVLILSNGAFGGIYRMFRELCAE